MSSREQATMNLPNDASKKDVPAAPGATRLLLNALMVGAVTYVCARFSLAFRVQPYHIAPLWPASAILFAVLVSAPVRTWPAYTLAWLFSNIIVDLQIGDTPRAILCFLIGNTIEVFIATVSVRRLAGGPRAFNNLRGLVAYILFAVVLAPFISAFVGAFGPEGNYWFGWRVWFLGDVISFLTLAPAIMTWIANARAALKNVSLTRCIEAGLAGCGLLIICVVVFIKPIAGQQTSPALLYLPLPMLLWAAVRFGPTGLLTSLLLVALLSIFGAVEGRGPFIATTLVSNVLSLQLFLITISLPLMFLSVLMEERRKNTSVLRESEARFRTVADAAPVMIWMSSTDKLCTFFNKGWLDFTGRTMGQETGNGWTDGVHPEDLEHCLEILGGSFDARQPFTMEYRLRRNDGEYRWLLDTGTPRFSADGEFLGYIGSCIDITERKHTELDQQLQNIELARVGRVALLGELAASLAHEINNPVGAMVTNANAGQRLIARGNIQGEDLSDLLADIVADGHRAREVIEGIRNMVRRKETTYSLVRIDEVIRDLLRIVKADALARKVALTTEINPNAGSVMADPVQLLQVLLNLTLNAFEAVSANRPNARQLVITGNRNGDGEIVIQLRDSGPGFPTGMGEHLFEPFFSTKTEGTGMGLAIARSIIEAHGGTLTGENCEQGGACFAVRLPQAREDASRAA